MKSAIHELYAAVLQAKLSEFQRNTFSNIQTTLIFLVGVVFACRFPIYFSRFLWYNLVNHQLEITRIATTMEIIIYGSQYGTAKQYAEELAQKTDIDVTSYEDVTEINRYDTVIYVGSLYAGGVLGMKKTLAKMKLCHGKKLIIATVGLADPTDTENTDNIKNSMKKQLSNELYEKAHIFHLRGGIDYSRLNFKHKTMMGLLYKKAVRLPEEKKTAEVKAMLETYNKKVDFIDFDSLTAIVNDI